MNTRLLVLILLLFIFKVSVAQGGFDDYLNKYPTEPEASTFDTYGNYNPPNAYGVVPVNIPLYDVTVKALNIPISLSYNSGAGIRVSQKSSEIGLGWSLNVNNFYIEQIFHGVSDGSRSHNAETNYNDIETRKNSTNINVVQGLYSQLKNSILKTYSSTDDFEVDDYSYNFNGHSGHFLFDENGVIINLSTSNSDLKIERGGVNGYTIKDSNGITYFFDNYIRYEIQVTSGSNPIIKYRWYLQKIELPTGEEIEFIYTDGTAETGRTQYETETIEIHRDEYIISEFIQPASATYLRPKPLDVPSYTTTRNKLNLLKTIKYPNGKLEFNNTFYSTSGKLMLPQIDLYNKIATTYSKVKTVKLHNNNFHLGSTSNNIASKLESVSYHDKNNNEINNHQFFYNDNPIPSRYSNNKDYWGYYAGPNTGGIPSLIYYDGTQPTTVSTGNREPKFRYAQAGVLNKIIYPTGGRTEFIYEPNYYSIETIVNNSNIINKNIPLTAIGPNPSIGNYTPEDSQSFNLQYGQVNSTGGIRVSYTCSRYTPGSTQTPYFRISTPKNAYSEVFHRPYERESGSFYITNLPSGQYNVTAFIGDATLDPNDPHPLIFGTAGVELTLSWTEYNNSGAIPIEKLMTGGGLRVKEIKSYTDSNTSIPSLIKKYEYGSKIIESKGVGEFMGVHTQINLIGTNKASIRDEDHIKAHFLTKKDYILQQGNFTQSGGCIQDIYTGTAIQLSSEPQFPIDYNGSSVYYNKVTVSSINNNNQSLGKTEYHYSLPRPKKLKSVDGDFSRSSSAEKDLKSYSPYTNVHLVKEMSYDTTSSLVHEKVYNYRTFNLKSLRKLKIALSDISLNQSGCYVTSATNEKKFIEKNFRYYKYYEQLEVDKLTSVVEKKHLGSEILLTSSSTSYVAANSFRASKTATTGSKGNIITTKILYPDDIKTGSTLQDNSLINGGSLNTTTFNATNKMQQDLHQIASPIQVETTVKDGATVLSQTIQRTNFYEPFTNLILPKNVQTLKGIYNASTNPLKSRIEYLNYYDNGNVKEVSKSDGTPIYYIWGYQKQYPIAKIENFTKTQAIAIQSSLINLAIAASNADTSLATENALRTTLNNIRNNSALLAAMVTTYTYDPLIGVTSMTDPKGYTIYYEYDDFNRLEFVKDASGKILSKNKYHYKEQQ